VTVISAPQTEVVQTTYVDTSTTVLVPPEDDDRAVPPLDVPAPSPNVGPRPPLYAPPQRVRRATVHRHRHYSAPSPPRDIGVDVDPAPPAHADGWLWEIAPAAGYHDGTTAATLDVRLHAPGPLEVSVGVGGLWRTGARPLGLGRLGPALLLVETSKLHVRVGGGGRLAFDEADVVPGWYAGAGLTWFLAAPLFVEVDATGGAVGNAPLVEGAAYIGVAWRAVALRVGFRALLLGEENLSTPMIGLGFLL